MRPSSKRLYHVQGDSSERAAQQRLPRTPHRHRRGRLAANGSLQKVMAFLTRKPFRRHMASLEPLLAAISTPLAHLQILQACRPSPDAMCPDAPNWPITPPSRSLGRKSPKFFLLPAYHGQRRAFVQYFFALAGSSLVAFFHSHIHDPAARRGATCAPPAFDISRAQSLP